MSDSEFGLYIAAPILVVIVLVMYFLLRNPKPPQPEPVPNPEVLAAALSAISSHTSRFDRDMYIEDMTEEQLKDEYVYLTIYILVSVMSRRKIDVVTYAIAELVTGRPADKQLYGLSEYYADTEYEQMCADGDDRYWRDVLAPMASTLSQQKKGEILLGGFLVEALNRALKNAGATDEFHVPEIFEDCIAELNKVAQVWFGDDAAQMMQTLRGQADTLLPQLQTRLAT